MKFDQERKKILSKEKGTIHKKNFRLRIALGFPNSYEVGMANLGFLTVHRLLNQIEGIFCERFFLFDYSPTKGVRTLESDSPLNSFPLVAFSIAFELDYLNVLKLLKLANIPLKSEDRDGKLPLLIAGGVAPTLNPETTAPFFDVLFIGEAEEMIFEFVDEYLKSLDKDKKISRDRLLFNLSQIKGIYVPKFYEPIYKENGWLEKINPKEDVAPIIEKRKAGPDLVPAYSSIITPLSHFKDFLLVEVGRGCGRGCRFCAAGFIYRPTRYYRKENILNLVEDFSYDCKNVGLVGSMVSDFPHLDELCFSLGEKGKKIGISSFRVDQINKKLLEILVKSGLESLTIAPEVGSERMWRVIRKNINKEDVLESAKTAAQSGILNLKLYFMIGLPFENSEDTNAIISLITEIQNIFLKQGKKKRIVVSLNPFVPKAQTPFQWAPMDKEENLQYKMKIIADGIKKMKGVLIEKKSIREAILQGILSMGNRRVGEGILHRVEENLKFSKAWEKARVDIDYLNFTRKDYDIFFPWDLIDAGVDKNYLWKEFVRAETESMSKLMDGR